MRDGNISIFLWILLGQHGCDEEEACLSRQRLCHHHRRHLNVFRAVVDLYGMLPSSHCRLGELPSLRTSPLIACLWSSSSMQLSSCPQDRVYRCYG